MAVISAQPDAIVKGIAGLLNERLALPDPESPGDDTDVDRTQQVKELLEAWGASKSHGSMTSDLAKVDAENPRETFMRKRFADTLNDASEFYWLLDDTIQGDAIQRRGEVITRISYFALKTKDRTLRLRVYFNAEAKVADFIRD